MLELLIALSIILILISFSLTSMHHLPDLTKDKINKSKLVDMLNQAQQEADNKLVNIVVCISDDNFQCIASHGNKVIMFLDNYQDGHLHNHSQLIANLQLNKGSEIWLRAFPSYRHYLSYQPHQINYADNGAWWLCRDAKPKWAIIVNQLGRVHTLKQDQNGNIYDSQGKKINCFSLN